MIIETFLQYEDLPMLENLRVALKFKRCQEEKEQPTELERD